MCNILDSFSPTLSPSIILNTSSFCRNSDYVPIYEFGMCYKVYDKEEERKTQSEAREFCRGQGAELLQLRSRKIEQYFQDLDYKGSFSD